MKYEMSRPELTLRKQTSLFLRSMYQAFGLFFFFLVSSRYILRVEALSMHLWFMSSPTFLIGPDPCLMFNEVKLTLNCIYKSPVGLT